MPSHKKTPIFLRIVTNKKQVVCINLALFSSFQIIEKAKILVKSKTGGDNEQHEADTIKFFLPSGTGLSYSVGFDISQEEFNYVCSTLTEFLYMNEEEFKLKHEAIEKAKMDEWNALSKENESKLPNLN